MAASLIDLLGDKAYLVVGSKDHDGLKRLEFDYNANLLTANEMIRLKEILVLLAKRPIGATDILEASELLGDLLERPIRYPKMIQ